MKKTMSNYLSTLSDNNFSVLEEIVVYKYKKFIDLYWLLKSYSDYISLLNYNDAPNDTLKIEVSMIGVDIEKVMKKLQKKIQDKESILIYNKSKKIFIEITNKE